MSLLQGNCRHGENCNFAHGLEELPPHRREAVLRDTSAYRGPPGITRPEGHQQVGHGHGVREDLGGVPGVMVDWADVPGVRGTGMGSVSVAAARCLC